MIKILLAILLITLSLSSVFAQSKHPRVIELEKALGDEASVYFNRRFPSEPFFVKVDVDPLFRTKKNSEPESELPYFDGSSEELSDEWDQPDMPLSYLRARTNKIDLQVSVSEKFSEEKINQIKEEIFGQLKLIPMRDHIEIRKTIKSESAENQSMTQTQVLLSVMGLIVFFLTGGYLVLRRTLRLPAQGSAPSAPLVQPIQNLPRSNEKSVPSFTSRDGGSHISHDSFRMTEVIRFKIQRIIESGTLPNLSDIMLLDQLTINKPQIFNTIMKEFPQDIQRDIYQYGLNHTWPSAMNSTPSFDLECLSVLDRMLQERDFRGNNKSWELLLIQIWRMDDFAVDFLKKVETDHAYQILQGLPKNLALKLARKVFPGGWARVLEKRSDKVLIEASSLQKYVEKSLEQMPLCNWSAIKEFRTDEEILTYLDLVSIDEEREIYDTLHEQSFVINQRPAFFKFFDMGLVHFQDMVDHFPIQMLAAAMINSPRTYIKRIMDCYDEKQKIVFSSYLKKIDEEGRYSEVQKMAKQQIAARVSLHFLQIEKEKVAHENIA